MSSKKLGAESFEDFYAKIFSSRWGEIRSALLRPERQVLRWNRFSKSPPDRLQDLERLTDYIFWQTESHPRGPYRGEDDLLDAYVMDPASLAPAWALRVQPGNMVLDMCAAPGGKTLILAEGLLSEGHQIDGQLVANDLSPDRRARLIKVLQQYIPRAQREGRIFVTGKEGVQFGLKQPGQFDRILLDAPCSGERHFFERAEDLQQWSLRRSEGLATRQYALLAAAWLALKPGGRIVYSTCALSPLENDEVVRKFIKKKKPDLVHQESDVGLTGFLAKASERSEFGWHFLPDHSGIGPIYFAVFEKRSPLQNEFEGD